ncbi:MAG: N-acetylmuramoyl-L-alanine amidase [Anaerovoracaceae bacterium]
MNKFIRAFPQSEFTFRLYDNTERKTWQQIKKTTGCFALINCGYFNMRTFSTSSIIMIGGKWKFSPTYHEYGLLIDRSGKMTVGTEKESVFDFCVGLPPMIINGERYRSYSESGKNGNTMVGIKRDGTPVFLICGKDGMQTSAQGVSDLVGVGCSDIFRFDGSWSTQGSLGDGMDLQPSQKRIVRNYILVFKKEGQIVPVKKAKVYVSPSMQEHNGNSKYDYIEETEMNLISDIVVPELNRHGVDTMRNKKESDLSVVVSESNKYAPDLHLAIHSNAHGTASGENKTARGAVVYIYKKGGASEKYANKIIEEMDVIQPFSNRGSGKISPQLNLWEVKRTNAPAVIVEVDFHDNSGAEWIQRNRENIADALVKSTLNYFGMKYIEKNEKPTDSTHWYDEGRAWAVQNKISDGTRPDDSATRAEVWKMLYNYKKNI